MTIQLGIAPINWCNDDDPSLGQDYSFEQCIAEMAYAGYVGTELGNKYPRDIPTLKQALREKGLSLASAWFSTYFTDETQYEKTISRFLEHLSFMRGLGASFINICECGHAIQGTNLPVLSHHKPEFTAQQWQQLIAGIHTLGRIAYDFNMTLVYHYHAGTGVFFEHEIKYLMDNTSPNLVSLLLDTGHAMIAGVDPVRLIHQFGERIRYVHLKDVRASILTIVHEKQLNFMDGVRAGVFTVPGDGMIDFKAVFQALRDHEYQGWMIVEAEQDPKKAPPLLYAENAFRYLQPLIASLG